MWIQCLLWNTVRLKWEISYKVQDQFSSVQSHSHVLLFAIPWTAAHQASLSITSSWSLLRLMSIESVMPSNISSSVIPFYLHLKSYPASVSFQMSQFFASGGQSTGVSVLASVLPMNIQDWSLFGWTGWISLLSKGLSRVFSNTAVQMHQFFGAQLNISYTNNWASLVAQPYYWFWDFPSQHRAWSRIQTQCEYVNIGCIGRLWCLPESAEARDLQNLGDLSPAARGHFCTQVRLSPCFDIIPSLVAWTPSIFPPKES